MKSVFKRNIWLILLILIGLIPLLDLFHAGVPLTHDIETHLGRVASFYQSLTEGNLFPRWAGNLNWGYGTPILSFVYPLPSYLASVFLFLGFSLINSVKIIFVLTYILSGIFMYLWIKEIWGKKAGIVSAVFYLFAPYRFVDLYVRGALGECVAFLFLPMILYFLKKKNFFGISFSMAGLILSHNMLALIFLIPILGYLGYLSFLGKTFRDKLSNAFCFLLSAIYGFTLSAFFWLPAVFEAKYTLRDIVSRGNVNGFENFPRLIWSSWNYGGSGQFSVQVGLLQWLIIILTAFLIWKLKKNGGKLWLYILFLYICFWLSIFFILPVSQGFYKITPFLQNFQFAWRWLSLAIFPPAVFAGLLIYFFPEKLKSLAVVLVVLITILLNKDFVRPVGFLNKPDSFYQKVYQGTTDTGEASPIWSIRFMEKKAAAHLEIIDGTAYIKEVSRTTTEHVYNIEAETQSRFRENTLYFPGWRVLVDGKETAVEFQDQANRGLMTFYVSEGKHRLEIIFGETKLRSLANLISGLGFLGSLGYLGIRRLKR